MRNRKSLKQKAAWLLTVVTVLSSGMTISAAEGIRTTASAAVATGSEIVSDYGSSGNPSHQNPATGSEFLGGGWKR